MKTSIVLRIVFSIGLLTFLIFRVDLAKIFELFATTSLLIYPLFFIPFLLSIFLNSISVHFLLFSLSVKDITLKELTKLKLIARSFSLFFPGQLGEFSLVPLLKMKDVPMGKSMAAVTVDKVISLVVLAGFATYGFFVFFDFGTSLKIFLFLFFVLIVALISLSSNDVRNFVKKYILRKYAILFAGYYQNVLFFYRRRRGVLIFNGLITTLVLFSTSIIIRMLLSHFGFSVGLVSVMSIQAMGALSSVIPISLSGLGVRESLITLLFYQQGVDPVVITSILLVFLFVAYTISGLTTIIVSKDFNLKSIKRLLENESTR